MEPQNTNPPQNPGPPTPPPAGPQRSDFNRPIQSFSRPHSIPVRTPGQATPAQPAQPQQVNPNPVQPVAPQPVRPRPIDGFAPAAPQAPIQPVQPQPQTPVAPATPAYRPLPPQPQPMQPPQPQRPAFAQPRPFEQPRPSQPDPLDQLNQVNVEADIDRQDRPQEKRAIPKGLLAIALVSIIGLVLGIIDKSQHSMLFTVILGLDVVVAAVMLFFRKEMVRKVAAGLAIVTVTASAALVLSYRGLADNTVKAESLFVAEAKKLQAQSPTKQLTDEQQQHLDAMQLRLEAQQDGVGGNSPLVYGKYTATILMFGLVALYLTRSKVKEAFQEVKL